MAACTIEWKSFDKIIGGNRGTSIMLVGSWSAGRCPINSTADRQDHQFPQEYLAERNSSNILPLYECRAKWWGRPQREWWRWRKMWWWNNRQSRPSGWRGRKVLVHRRGETHRTSPSWCCCCCFYFVSCGELTAQHLSTGCRHRGTEENIIIRLQLALENCQGGHGHYR